MGKKKDNIGEGFVYSSTTNKYKRGLRLLIERGIKWETRLARLPEAISNIEEENKQLLLSIRLLKSDIRTKRSSTIVNHIEIREIITLIREKERQRIQLQYKINKKEELKTVLEKVIIKARNQVIPKYQICTYDSSLTLESLKCFRAELESRKELGVEVPLVPYHKMGPCFQNTPVSQLTDEELVNSFENPDDRMRAAIVVDKLRKYFSQLKESEGFDLDPDTYPGFFYGFTSVVPLGKRSSVWGSIVDYEWISNFALSKYNIENSTRFKYMELLKTGAIINFISTFYVTFLGESKNGDSVTFQAIVACNSRYPEWEDHSCSLVRVKATNEVDKRIP